MNRQVLLLRSIIENPKITQRALCKTTGLALGSVNSLLRESTETGLVRETKDGREVTEEGFRYLEPYRVDCAVIMAAACAAAAEFDVNGGFAGDGRDGFGSTVEALRQHSGSEAR